MVKLTVLYKKPSDPQEFDRHYNDIHTPLASKMPGLKRYEVAKITGAPGGESPYHLIAELYFDDFEAMKAAMSSPEGKAAAKDVGTFAKDLVEMMFSQVEEKVRVKI
jgi:uncharacterized protein (TIGR02118 family)